jgi:hypothetical protein
MMALKLAAPIEKTFELEETDKEFPAEDGTDKEPTIVTVKQASQKESETRLDMFSKYKTVLKVYEDGSQEMSNEENRNILRIQRKDAFLTLVGCNIQWQPEGKKKPENLFKFENGKIAMTETEFADAWGMLPAFVCREIHSKILEVNPTWRTAGEG